MAIGEGSHWILKKNRFFDRGITMNRHEYFVERAAAKGNARALYLCAMIRLKRNENIQSIVQLLKRAISYGEILAYYELGILYESFEYGVRSIFSAAKMFYKGYELGDVRCAAKIGDLCISFSDAGCYSEEFCINDVVKADNIGVSDFMQIFLIDKNTNLSLNRRYRMAAMEWYKIGASAGCGYAYYQLARNYENEWLIGDDAYNIFNSYERAAELGDCQGAFALGRLYEEGCLIAKDLFQAKQWYATAVGMGSAEAAYRLGILLNWNSNLINASEKMGYILPGNYPKFYMDLERFAKKGDAVALYEMGCILANGREECDDNDQWEIEKNEDKAQQLFRMSAALGCIRSYGMMGVLKERHNGELLMTPHKNPWYVRGVELGLGYACWKMYKERKENLSDYVNSLNELKSNLTPVNMWILGKIYEDELVVDANAKSLAFKFYRMSGDAGFTPGVVSACKMVIRGYISDHSLHVCQLLTKAATTGDVGAVYWLAYCLENGLYIARDLNAAKHLYCIASKYGNVSAMVGYGRVVVSTLELEEHNDFGQSFLYKFANSKNDSECELSSAEKELDKYINGLGMYFANKQKLRSPVDKILNYLNEIAEVCQLKRMHNDVLDFLFIAIEKGRGEALEIVARYYAKPRLNKYLEENLKKSISFYERAIKAGRENLTCEMGEVQQRLKKCADGMYIEEVPRVVLSSSDIPF